MTIVYEDQDGQASDIPVRRIKFTINGKKMIAEVEPRLLLAHLIRRGLALTGTHMGCDTTNCGACTVLVDGRSARSCAGKACMRRSSPAGVTSAGTAPVKRVTLITRDMPLLEGVNWMRASRPVSNRSSEFTPRMSAPRRGLCKPTPAGPRKSARKAGGKEAEEAPPDVPEGAFLAELAEWADRVTVGWQLTGEFCMSESSLGRKAPNGLSAAELERRKIRDERGSGQALVGRLLKGCLDRGVVPEVVTLGVHPKGQLRRSGQWQLTSRHGRTRLGGAWTVIELWTLSAEDLLAFNDVGVIPWVPLAQSTLAPEELLRRCRERIEQQAKPEEQANLLAVTQVMTSVRYNERNLLSILGGRTMIVETPLIQELLRDELQSAVLELLRAKYADVPEEVVARVRAIQDVQQLRQLNTQAGMCPDLDAFRTQLPA